MLNFRSFLFVKQEEHTFEFQIGTGKLHAMDPLGPPPQPVLLGAAESNRPPVVVFATASSKGLKVRVPRSCFHRDNMAWTWESWRWIFMDMFSLGGLLDIALEVHFSSGFVWTCIHWHHWLSLISPHWNCIDLSTVRPDYVSSHAIINHHVWFLNRCKFKSPRFDVFFHGCCNHPIKSSKIIL